MCAHVWFVMLHNVLQALSEMVCDGRAHTVDVTPLSFERLVTGDALLERNIV